MLIICAYRPVLLNHLPKVLIDVFLARKWLIGVLVLFLFFALLCGLFVSIELKVGDKVVNCIYFLAFEHYGSDLRCLQSLA